MFLRPSRAARNECQPITGNARKPSVTYTHDLDKPVPEMLSADDGCKIIALLVAACPNVCELSAGGGLGEKALRILGAGWSKLTTLVILNQAIVFTHSNENSQSSQHQDFVLPRLTHLHLSWSSPGQARRMSELFACPSLTHVSVRKGWFTEASKDWLALCNVKVIDCAQLLFRPNPSMMITLRYLNLRGLECIHLSQLSCVPVSVTHLAALLKAAPSLKEISLPSPSWEGETVMINDSTCLLLNQMYYVHERMQAGLTLVNVTLDCTCKVAGEDSDRLISMEQLLITIPHFRSFKSLSVTSQQSDGRCGCLSAINTAFPALETLSLGGPWLDLDFQDLQEDVVVFMRMRSLQLMASRLTSASLLPMVACMPWLTKLDLSSISVKSRSRNFQAQLRSSQITRDINIGGGSSELGDWTLQSKHETAAGNEGSGGFTTWNRIKVRVVAK